MVEFTIDTREPRKMLAIFKALNIPYKRKMMEYGDYRTDKVIFERKSVADFAQSSQDRIFEQIDKLVDNSQKNNLIPYLVISGDFEELKKKLKKKMNIKLNPNAIFGALASIAVRYYGISIIWNLRGDAELVFVLHKIAEKIEEGKFCQPRRVRLRKIHRNRRVAHICQLMRVSPKVAVQLLRKFKTTKRILFATISDLEGVPGIGPLTARRIKSLIGD